MCLLVENLSSHKHCRLAWLNSQNPHTPVLGQIWGPSDWATTEGTLHYFCRVVAESELSVIITSQNIFVQPVPDLLLDNTPMKSDNYQQKVCHSPLWSLKLTAVNSGLTPVASLWNVMRSHFSLPLTISTVHSFKRLTQRSPEQHAPQTWVTATNKQNAVLHSFVRLAFNSVDNVNVVTREWRDRGQRASLRWCTKS